MSKQQAQHWLGRIGAIVGLAAAFFTLNAVAFDSEVDRKITFAQELTAQQNAAVLHNLQLLAQRQVVESLAAEIRFEEFWQNWCAAELRREADPGRLYELEQQQRLSQGRLAGLYDRYNNASERLEALQATVPKR